MQSELISSNWAQKHEGDNMNPIKKVLVLFALLCVIGSAAAVSAEDIGSEGGYAGSNYEGADGVSESQYNPDDQLVGDEAGEVPDTESPAHENPEFLPPDWNHDEHAAGEPENETAGNQTNTTDVTDTQASQTVLDNVTSSVTGNSTGNATANAPHSMLETGNPILALLAVGAVLGSAAVIRRK